MSPVSESIFMWEYRKHLERVEIVSVGAAGPIKHGWLLHNEMKRNMWTQWHHILSTPLKIHHHTWTQSDPYARKSMTRCFLVQQLNIWMQTLSKKTHKCYLFKLVICCGVMKVSFLPLCFTCNQCNHFVEAVLFKCGIYYYYCSAVLMNAKLSQPISGTPVRKLFSEKYSRIHVMTSRPVKKLAETSRWHFSEHESPTQMPV